MNRWVGAAAICVNSDRQLLMVLQGKPEEEKRWSVPSGGKNKMKPWKIAVLGKFMRRQVTAVFFKFWSAAVSLNGSV
ncbi:hypothetical protein D3C73_687090 [compost metagenome]